MAFKLTKYSYKSLRQLSVQDRLQVAQDREMGQWLLSLLTPSQFVDLFPRYYRESMPDISGFTKAMPSSMTAAKQRAAEEQLSNTVSGAAAGSNYKAGGWKRKYQEGLDNQRRASVSKAGVVPPPQLSPEQRKAFDDLKAAPMTADDPRAKMFAGLSAEQMAKVGISKVTENGKEVFKYSAPTVSEEEARKYIDSSNSWKGGKFTAANYTAVLKEVGFNDRDATLMTAVGIQESNHNTKSANDKNPARERSYGLFQVNINAHPIGSPELNYAGVYSQEDLFDPVKNAKVAYYLYYKTKTGIKHWGGYTDGGYRQYLSEAEAVAGTPAGLSRDSITADYSDKSMQLAKEKLVRQKEEERIGSLAAYTTAQVDSSAKPGPTGAAATTKWSQITPMGGTGYCGRGVVDLTKKLFKGVDYFDNTSVVGGLGGNASSIAYGNQFFQKSGMYQPGERVSVEKLTPEFIASLPPGTIVAAGGGRSDGAGHIQMKVGDRWMSDHAQKKFYLPTENRPYKDYTILRLTPQGESALSQRGFYTQTEQNTQPQNVKPPQASPPPASADKETHVEPNPSSVELKKEKESPPVPRAGPQGDASIPQVETPKVTNKPAEPTPERYRVDTAKFINAIKATPEFKSQAGFFAGMVPDSTIINGFNDDPRVKAAGVHLDEKGVMHFKRGMTGDVKQVMADFDTKSFMTKIEDEKKKTEVKPAEQKPVEKPATERPPVPTPANPAPQVETPKVTNKPAEPPKGAPATVKTNAMGGVNKINTEEISAYPIGGLNGDNAVVVNKQQKPLFTMNTNEAMTIDPKNDTAIVTPNTKERNVGATQSSPLESMFSDFTQSVRNLSDKFDMNKSTSDPPQKPDPFPAEGGAWLNNLNKLTEQSFHSPSARRAFYRSQGQSVDNGTGTNHFSHGNNS